MKTIALIIALCCMAGLSSCAGNKKNIEKDMATRPLRDSTYEVAVAFGSMCCGTASADFIFSFLEKYNSRSSAQRDVLADVASGCGKEGEFYILFQLTDAEKEKFVAALLPLVEQEEKKNRQKDASSGSISLQFNISVSDLSYCRGGIQQSDKWQLRKAE